MSGTLRQRGKGAGKENPGKASTQPQHTQPQQQHAMSVAGVLFYTLVVFGLEGGAYLLYNSLGLKRKAVLFLMSSTAGIAHSSYALYQCTRVVSTGPFVFNSRNTRPAILCFQATFSYFIFDSIFCWAVEYPGFWGFVGHHVASAAVVASCSIIGYGDKTLALWYILGELSNAPQNLYLILEMLAEEDAWFAQPAADGAVVLRALFMALFVTLRVVFSPPAYLIMLYCLVFPGKSRFNKDANRITIPLFVAGLWAFMIGGILVGSYGFIQDNWSFLDVILGPAAAGGVEP